MKSPLTTFLLFVLPATTCWAEDWPQWRGPSRDGQIAKADWPKSLDSDHLKQSWRIPLGPSYSGPIVVGDRVFVTETKDELEEAAIALDRKTGKELWRVQWPGSMKVPFFAAANGSWIRSTPACDGKQLYVVGMRDVMVAIDVEKGVENWRIDFAKQFGTELPAFGAVCSPLLDGEHLYLQAAFSIVKIRTSDGGIVWRTSPESGGAFGRGMGGSAFSSPVIATIAGKRQLVIQTRTELTGIDLETGSKLWAQAIPAFRGMNILTPLVFEDTVFTSAYGGASFRYGFENEGSGQSIQTIWESKQQAYMSSPVLIGKHLYMHLRNQRFTCIDTSDGTSCWTTTPFGKYWSMVVNGDRILSLDERGDLRLISANHEQYAEISQRKVSDEPAWAHLSVVGDQIFVRSLHGMTAWKWQTN